MRFFIFQKYMQVNKYCNISLENFTKHSHFFSEEWARAMVKFSNLICWKANSQSNEIIHLSNVFRVVMVLGSTRNKPKNGFKASWIRIFLPNFWHYYWYLMIFLGNSLLAHYATSFWKTIKYAKNLTKKWRKALFNLP